ncbi:uncharacterized protein [Pseudochaenichthys georgianus]|uniref:uncharacterized protein n=1 Tax=Pseudochaenichthys georgianus TaxID=52239 RepID=UPI0039C40C86
MTVSDRLPEEARSAGAGSASNSSELVQLPATREEFMAAQFPEAIPLRKITAPVITKALLKFFSLFGLPKVVQTDQGTNFMSKVFARVLDTLGIKHVTSSPYHPESQGELERFHQTMKCMLRKHCHESHKDWDDGVPLVLFAAREAVQESLGFSPAELVFGHEVRGPLRVLKEHLIMPTKTVCSIPEYVAKLKDRQNRACSLAREALTSTQGNMKKRYDQKAVARLFQPDKKLGETNYVIQTPDRRRPTRVCHINMLKKYCTREDQSESSKAHQVETTVSPMASVSKVSSNEDEDELVMRSATPQGARLSNTEVLADLPNYLSHLPDIQGSDIQKLIFDFACLFNDTPSQTSVLAHDVVLTNPSPIKQRAYRVNPVKREVMKREVEYLLKNGFARPSSSPWSSPCVLDTKSDGSPRFCTDFRKVNAVTVPDAHPLPLIDDCIDEIGPAQFVSKLDMLKGYWQVPLTQRASDISAFVTPDSFLQYTVMPFGMCNAPATFQRLVNLVLGHVPDCKAYLDDIVVYSKDWSSHMSTLREVFKCLSAASLTLNLAKCEFGKDFSKPFKLEVDASGVGTGAVLLQEDAQAIDHPVSYFSRKFNKHQLKYSTIEKEALALLFALQHFEVYLGSSVKPIKWPPLSLLLPTTACTLRVSSDAEGLAQEGGGWRKRERKISAPELSAEKTQFLLKGDKLLPTVHFHSGI